MEHGAPMVNIEKNVEIIPKPYGDSKGRKAYVLAVGEADKPGKRGKLHY